MIDLSQIARVVYDFPQPSDLFGLDRTGFED